MSYREQLSLHDLEPKLNIRKVNWAVLKRLGDIWSKNASVKKSELCYHLDDSEPYPDFPIELVPFRDHPEFLAASESTRSRVLSWGWIAYNERTITAEEKVANPAFQLLLNKVVPGVEHPDIRRTVAQSMIDEQYHTYMHLNAIALTKAERKLEDAMLPASITYRAYRACLSRATSGWERDLITVLFATVSEISINTLLSLLSQNKNIQPLHQMITYHHDQDEIMHMVILEEIGKNIFIHMSSAERKRFEYWFPFALESFVATDFSSWRAILQLCGFRNCDGIIADVQALKTRQNLIRDYSGLERMVQALDIEKTVDFDFTIQQRQSGENFRSILKLEEAL